MNDFKSCYGCTDRYVGCHSTCKRHHDEKETHAKNVARAKSESAWNDYQIGTKTQLLKRYKH